MEIVVGPEFRLLLPPEYIGLWLGGMWPILRLELAPAAALHDRRGYWKLEDIQAALTDLAKDLGRP